MIRTIVLIMAVALWLTGCGTSWRQQMADLRAGAQAAEQADATKRQMILAEVGRRVLALTANASDLPEPTQPAAAIAADPSGYIDASPSAPSWETPPPAPPSPWERWRHLGDQLVYWGGIIGALGLVVGIVAWIAGKAGWAGLIWSIIGNPLTAGAARLCASLGGISAVVGAGIVWAVAYWWAIVLAIVAALAIAAVIHRKDIRRAWDRVRRGSQP